MGKMNGDGGQPPSTPRPLGALPGAQKYIKNVENFLLLLRWGKWKVRGTRLPSTPRPLGTQPGPLKYIKKFFFK
jgi:hypothetical protein